MDKLNEIMDAIYEAEHEIYKQTGESSFVGTIRMHPRCFHEAMSCQIYVGQSWIQYDEKTKGRKIKNYQIAIDYRCEDFSVEIAGEEETKLSAQVGLSVAGLRKLPRTITERKQAKFPRSKKKRVRKKWSKNIGNWLERELVPVHEHNGKYFHLPVPVPVALEMGYPDWHPIIKER